MTWSNGTEATTIKDFKGGDGGMSGDVILTFDVAASTSLSKGDFIKLSSGNAAKCSATTDRMVGVATKAVDNSSGSAGDLQVPVLVRGIMKVDGVIRDSSSDYDAAIAPFAEAGLATGGQVVAAYGGTADPTVSIGILLSTQAVDAGSDITRDVLVYFDLLGRHADG